MTLTIIKILVAYLLGSVSGSLLLGKLRHVDIRTMGSGNAGGTNAFRTQGWLFALGVVLIDVIKGALAAAWIPALLLPGEMVPPAWLVLACGMAAVVGHCYPAWHGFRGGKGAATAIGVLVAVNPLLLVPMLGTWVLILVLTGFVGLATVMAGFSLVPAAWGLEGPGPLLWFVMLLAVFIAFTHRSNFRHMVSGEEHRFERARLTNWFRNKGS